MLFNILLHFSANNKHILLGSHQKTKRLRPLSRPRQPHRQSRMLHAIISCLDHVRFPWTSHDRPNWSQREPQELMQNMWSYFVFAFIRVVLFIGICLDQGQENVHAIAFSCKYILLYLFFFKIELIFRFVIVFRVAY